MQGQTRAPRAQLNRNIVISVTTYLCTAQLAPTPAGRCGALMQKAVQVSTLHAVVTLYQCHWLPCTNTSGAEFGELHWLCVKVRTQVHWLWFTLCFSHVYSMLLPALVLGSIRLVVTWGKCLFCLCMKVRAKGACFA